jgi:hypothetical protein
VSIVGRRKSLRVDLLRWIILFRKHQRAATNQRTKLTYSLRGLGMRIEFVPDDELRVESTRCGNPSQKIADDD